MRKIFKGKIYLVGGAVRNSLLNKEIRDRDFVVVGSTAEEMLSLGLVPIGKSFPIFLHPISKDEYALARTLVSSEKANCFSFSPDVSIEEDLALRDVSINAMAIDMDTGELIDPFEGKKDLENKVLRCLPKGFGQDPLRVLRVARLAAEFNFTVETSSLALMKKLAHGGTLKNLIGERVWGELMKALALPNPLPFFQILSEADALKEVFPEIEDLKNIPQRPEYHPEGDVYTHTLLVLQNICHLTPQLELRFAALLHDLGKAKTPKEILPKHIGHEARGVPLVQNFCQRLKAPNQFLEFSIKFCKLHLKGSKIREMRPAKILKFIEDLDALRNPQIVQDFFLCCLADCRGKKSLKGEDIFNVEKELAIKESKEIIEQSLMKLRKAPYSEIVRAYPHAHQGDKLIEKIRNLKIHLIRQVLKERNTA